MEKKKLNRELLHLRNIQVFGREEFWVFYLPCKHRLWLIRVYENTDISVHFPISKHCPWNINRRGVCWKSMGLVNTTRQLLVRNAQTTHRAGHPEEVLLQP